MKVEAVKYKYLEIIENFDMLLNRKERFSNRPKVWIARYFGAKIIWRSNEGNWRKFEVLRIIRGEKKRDGTKEAKAWCRRRRKKKWSRAVRVSAMRREVRVHEAALFLPVCSTGPINDFLLSECKSFIKSARNELKPSFFFLPFFV